MIAERRLIGISWTTAAMRAVAALALASNLALAQSAPVVTGDARVDKLLNQMTLAEKLTLIHDGPEDPKSYQGQAGYIGGIPRLGIPALRLADGPPGVLSRHPSQAETATMGVAATFDIRLAEANGVVIGREALALGIDVALQPFINLDRDLAFKRAYNTFGQDPLLTSQIGAAEIRGIQSQHVMAVAKHFIGFDTPGSDVWIDDQTLHEVYLPPFEAAVEAEVAAVMSSYNHINGPYACGNAATLKKILREELGFKGFVTSDWGATHSADFLNAGLDMEMIDGRDNSGYREPAFLGAEPASLPQPVPRDGQAMSDLYGGQLGRSRRWWSHREFQDCEYRKGGWRRDSAGLSRRAPRERLRSCLSNTKPGGFRPPLTEGWRVQNGLFAPGPAPPAILVNLRREMWDRRASTEVSASELPPETCGWSNPSEE